MTTAQVMRKIEREKNAPARAALKKAGVKAPRPGHCVSLGDGHEVCRTGRWLIVQTAYARRRI